MVATPDAVAVNKHEDEVCLKTLRSVYGVSWFVQMSFEIRTACESADSIRK